MSHSIWWCVFVDDFFVCVFAANNWIITPWFDDHNISGWAPSPPQEECLSWTRTNFRCDLLVCHRLLVSAAFKYVSLWLPLCQGCLIDPRWGTKLLWDFFVTCQCLVRADTQIMSPRYHCQGLESKSCLIYHLVIQHSHGKSWNIHYKWRPW